MTSKAGKILLNGTDCLMLAFDHQLKKEGFAGNLAQIVLGLERPVDAAVINNRLQRLVKRFPILAARLKRQILKRIPYWETSRADETEYPMVFTHAFGKSIQAAELEMRKRELLNKPFQTAKGEWMRLDLLDLPDGTMEVVLTWHHALMDAHGAEYFLYLLGDEKARCPESAIGGQCGALAPFDRYTAGARFKEKWRMADKAFAHVTRIGLVPPISLYTIGGESIFPRFDYRILAFSADESRKVLEEGWKICGILNNSFYFMAAVMMEFHGLHKERGIETPSYVISFPISLRKIGTRYPMFTNQAATLLYAFTSGDISDFASMVRQIKAQAQDAISRGMLPSNIAMTDIARGLPSWVYARKVKQALKGEIVSLVFANPGDTRLAAFLGAEVTYQHHIPTIVTPPGIGIVFYRSRGKLHLTLTFAVGLLTPEEAAGLLEKVRFRLLGEAEWP
jgi:hypothetical protein